MSRTVFDTLETLEKALLQQIADLRSALAPLERELAQVKIAKAALKPPARPPSDGSDPPPAESSQPSDPDHSSEASSPYRHMTMKELVIKALTEQFPEGASAHQLIAFFSDGWGRDDVVRSSLSPQLSRLKDEGKVVLEGRRWKLSEKTYLHNLKIPF